MTTIEVAGKASITGPPPDDGPVIDVRGLRMRYGSTDVLDSIQRVLNAADSLVGSDFLGRIKKMLK